MSKSALGISLWAFTCIAAGLGIAYLTGVSTSGIFKAAILMSALTAITFAGAWLLQSLRK